MRRGDVFWGGILVILGGLFLLQANGLISDVFGWFWPILLVLLGGWILAGRYLPGLAGNSMEDFSIDLQGATQIGLNIDHGAGSIALVGGAPAGVAVRGTQASGMSMKTHLQGERLDVKIDAGPSFIPFLGPDSGVWQYQLNQDVPFNLDVDSGASSMDFDLTDIKVAHLSVDTGASTLKIKLPAHAGSTLVDIDSGAATLDLTVPQGVAARVRARQGASTFNIDLSRFPMLDNGLYQSADFATASNKVEINLDGGANAVTVR